MKSLKKFLLPLAGLILTAPIQAAGILELADEADLIVLGKTVEVPNNSVKTVKLSVAPEIVLKGNAGASPVQLVFLKPDPTRLIRGFGPSFPPQPGTRAFWFLRRLPAGSTRPSLALAKPNPLLSITSDPVRRSRITGCLLPA